MLLSLVLLVPLPRGGSRIEQHANGAHRLKKKEAEKRKRMKERLSLKMEHPGDRLDISEDFELFSLKQIRSAASLSKLGLDATGDVIADDDEDKDEARAEENGGACSDEEDYVAKLDAELNAMYADYQAVSRSSAAATHTIRLPAARLPSVISSTPSPRVLL